MIDPEGQVIKSYVLKSQIGAGSFANIYRAYQPVIERDVAIKVIHPQFANNPDFVRRFEVEAQIVARLEHPHIVPLYDYWREPDGAFLVMRWLRGGSLRESLREHSLPQESIAKILDQVTAALATAHRNGIVHQDIKPDNLLMDTEGNAYLSDFGIARSFMENMGRSGGTRYGSPAYVSPETFLGKEITPQSDIYSLGIMLYEFLTGVLPYGAEDPNQIMEQHAVAPMPSVRTVNPELPKAFDEIIWKATAKHPEARYTSAPLIASEFRWIVSADKSQPNIQIPIDLPAGDAPPGDNNLRTVDLGLIPQPRNPFKGLRAFEEADMHDFFGRAALVKKLLAALDKVEDSGRFLAVVGPSGSGKSSVVKAGLIPALRQNAIKDSNN